MNPSASYQGPASPSPCIVEPYEKAEALLDEIPIQIFVESIRVKQGVIIQFEMSGAVQEVSDLWTATAALTFSIVRRKVVNRLLVPEAEMCSPLASSSSSSCSPARGYCQIKRVETCRKRLTELIHHEFPHGKSCESDTLLEVFEDRGVLTHPVLYSSLEKYDRKDATKYLYSQIIALWTAAFKARVPDDNYPRLTYCQLKNGDIRLGWFDARGMCLCQTIDERMYYWLKLCSDSNAFSCLDD